MWVFYILIFSVFPTIAFSDEFLSKVQVAVFSKDQFFWPKLDSSLHHNRQLDTSVNLGVLPIKVENYEEVVSCDSCHRLSQNGIEFYFENYLKDKLTHRFPHSSITLIAPHFNLLKQQKLDSLPKIIGFEFDWKNWFGMGNKYGHEEPVLYRPRDRFTSKQVGKDLGKIGGILNQTYLLIPNIFKFKISPFNKNSHHGGIDWSFGLVFWNVAESRAEWSIIYEGAAKRIDLDKSFDRHLDQVLGRTWDQMPTLLFQLMNKEIK